MPKFPIKTNLNHDLNRESKITLLSLRRQWNQNHPDQQITTEDIAKAASLRPGDVYSVELGSGFVRDEVIDQTLDAFSHLTKQKYTRNNVLISRGQGALDQ